MTWDLMVVASPCVDLCRLDVRSGPCAGCLRTAEEIRRWRTLTDRQRRRVLDEVKRRRALLDCSKSRKAAALAAAADQGSAA